jgi:hypothetical protein
MTLGNFTTDTESELAGLDETEHGETGFDFGPSLNTMVGASVPAPRAASFPPNSKPKHFTLTVVGPDERALMDIWSKLCQSGTDPSADMKKLYANVTTISGNKFRFRGGDANQMKESLEKVLKPGLNGGITKVIVET